MDECECECRISGPFGQRSIPENNVGAGRSLIAPDYVWLR